MVPAVALPPVPGCLQFSCPGCLFQVSFLCRLPPGAALGGVSAVSTLLPESSGRKALRRWSGEMKGGVRNPRASAGLNSPLLPCCFVSTAVGTFPCPFLCTGFCHLTSPLLSSPLPFLSLSSPLPLPFLSPSSPLSPSSTLPLLFLSPLLLPFLSCSCCSMPPKQCLDAANQVWPHQHHRPV